MQSVMPPNLKDEMKTGVGKREGGRRPRPPRDGKCSLRLRSKIFFAKG
jgi:hypothetical protein